MNEFSIKEIELLVNESLGLIRKPNSAETVTEKLKELRCWRNWVAQKRDRSLFDQLKSFFVNQIETLDEKESYVLTLYYFDGFSDQKIFVRNKDAFRNKYTNEQISTSRTIHGIRKSGKSALAKKIYAAEQEAQAEWFERWQAPVCIGRDEEITTLTHYLSTEKLPYLIHLCGMEGIGKTHLARTIIRNLAEAETFLQIIWLNEDWPDITKIPSWSEKQNAVRQLIFRRLAIQIGLDNDVSADLSVQKLRDVLGFSHTLLVIDNLNCFEFASIAFDLLYPLLNPTKLLTIGQLRPPSSHYITLFELSALKKSADVYQFLKNFDQTISLEEAEECYDIVGGHPKALDLLRRLLPYLSLSSLKEEFGGTADINKLYKKACMLLSAESYKLLYAMTLLAYKGGRDQLIATLSGFDNSVLPRLMGELRHGGLLEKASADFFSILPLTRNYLSHQIDLDDELHQWYIGRLDAGCEYWEQVSTKLPFAEIYHHVVHLLDIALAEPVLWQKAASSLTDYTTLIENSPYWYEATFRLERAIELATSEISAELVWLLDDLSHFYRIEGRYEEAIAIQLKGLEYAKFFPDKPKLEARSSINLATNYIYTKQFDLSAQYAQRGLELYLELPDKEKYLCFAYNEIGFGYYKYGNYFVAIHYYSQAAESTDDPSNLARVHNNWGNALAANGDYARAWMQYKIAWEYATVTDRVTDGVTDKYPIAGSWLKLCNDWEQREEQLPQELIDYMETQLRLVNQPNGRKKSADPLPKATQKEFQLELDRYYAQKSG